MNRLIMALIAVAAATSGCATQPQMLPVPSEIDCVYLNKPLSFTARYGMFNVPWTTTLENGPYVSVRTDHSGTYYRAPPGGLVVIGASGSQYHGRAPPGWPSRMDGGFYIPNSPSQGPKVFRYFSLTSASTDPVYQASTCSTVGYERTPSGVKLKLLPLAASGAVGGALGGIVGRSIAKGGTMTYGQAAGAGAAGGAIAGLIIGEILNSQVGGMLFTLPVKDAHFSAELREIAEQKVPLMPIRHTEEISTRPVVMIRSPGHD